MNSRLIIGIIFIHLFYTQIVVAQDIIKSDNLDSLLQTINDPNKKVDAIIAYLEEPENRYLENVAEYANRAFIISKQNNYMKGNIQAMIKLGNYYYRSSDYKTAMEFAQKAKVMSEDLNFEMELANALNLIGTIYSELDDYDHSSQYLFMSLKLFEKLKDKKGISSLLGKIGIDFYSQQDYKKALEYYNNSLILAKEINSLSSIKTAYNNIAVVYQYQKKYDTAIIALREALAINIKLGDKLSQGINIMNIGYDQMNNGKLNDALQSFQQSLDLFTGLNNRIHMAECYLNFGYCYQAMNQIDKSIDYFKKALQEGQSKGYYRIISPSANILKLIYTEKRDTVSAYKYVVLEKLAGDSLFASKQQKLLSKFELQYLYEKKEFERHQAQQVKNIIMWIIIFSLVAVLIIFGLVISRYRLKSKFVILEKEKIELEKENVELEKEKLKSELDIKDRELTIHLISLIKKNEMLADFSDKLALFEQNVKSNETKEVLTQISQELRKNIDDKMLEDFSLRFQEVHAGFYEKLLKDYPDLTQNELKLCAFLRLNMTTKEISELTGQRFATIDQSRHRLRIKLGISNSETNLVVFLANI
jgi:tetratricopeptide (TPR) repeat protein